MFPIGIYVKPTKPCKKIHIRLIENKYHSEYKKLNPRISKRKYKKKINKTKKKKQN